MAAEGLATFLALVAVLLLTGPAAASRSLKEAAIVNGADSAPGRYPWNVRIREDFPGSYTTCTGSLIGPRSVLTAGHCLYGEAPTYPKTSTAAYSIFVGQDDTNGPASAAKVASADAHPNYRPSEQPLGHFDVAILTLDRSLPGPYAKLHLERPTAQDQDRSLTAIGWGLMLSANNVHGVLATHLQQGDGQLLDYNGRLNRPFSDMNLPAASRAVAPAGSAATSISTCPGDSGGPLFMPGPADGTNDVIWGTTSYGYAGDAPGCALASFARPSVFMDVTAPEIASFIQDMTCWTTCLPGVEADYAICPWKLYGVKTAVSVHCMPDARAYLNLNTPGDADNFALYGASPNSQFQTPRTKFNRVLLEPTTLQVKIDDYTFAVSGTATYGFGGPTTNQVAYATCGDCLNLGTRTGRANINLTNTPLAVKANQFQVGGWNPNGGADYSANNQVVNLQAGGYCGGIGPIPETDIDHFNGPYLQLYFVDGPMERPQPPPIVPNPLALADSAQPAATNVNAVTTSNTAALVVPGPTGSTLLALAPAPASHPNTTDMATALPTGFFARAPSAPPATAPAPAVLAAGPAVNKPSVSG